MQDLKIEHLSPGEILPRSNAYRKHGDHQLDSIAANLQENGCLQPPLVDRNNRIVCGEAVVEAAKRIGLNRIPVIRITHRTPDQLRLYAIAANKLAELSGYDDELLAFEIQDLNALLGEPDLSNLGFEPAELDRLLGFTGSDFSEDDGGIAPDPDRPVSQLGDVWNLAESKLLCGDALESSNYDKLLNGEKAQLVFSDLPYNLPAKMISGNGKHKHEDFVQAAGEMNNREFVRFLVTVMRLMKAYSIPGSLHMLFMSWHYLHELLRAGHLVYDELKNICTWVKSQGGMGSLFRSQTEFIAVFKNGNAAHINNIQLGKFGRNRTNAWFYDGMNTPSPERDELLAMHATVKPLKMIAEGILDVSTKNGIVLDPFVGSGTTIIAAHKTGRRARAMELDPLYVDVALRRFRKETGIEPVRAADGVSLSDIEQQHSIEGDV